MNKALKSKKVLWAAGTLMVLIIFIALVLTFTTGNNNIDSEKVFRNISWGMSINQVKLAEKKDGDLSCISDNISEMLGLYKYEGYKYNDEFPCTVVYYSQKDKEGVLGGIMLEFDGNGDIHETLKNILVRQYGDDFKISANNKNSFTWTTTTSTISLFKAANLSSVIKMSPLKVNEIL